MLVAVRAGWRRRYACCSDTLKMKRPKPIEPSPVCYRPLSWLMTTILGTIFDDQVGAFNSEGETNSKSHPCQHALCAHCESINFCQGGNRLRWWLIDPCKTVQPPNGRRLSSWSSGAALRSGAAASRTWCQPCALFDVLRSVPYRTLRAILFESACALGLYPHLLLELRRVVRGSWFSVAAGSRG